MNVVILAAGMGKRMRSDLPKVLHPIAGQPMLAHVIDRARSLSPKRLVVVYGHGGEQVPKQLAADDITWARQMPQLGTGHAVMQAAPWLDETVPTLILYGDVPLTTSDTLARLCEAARSSGDAKRGEQMAILTVELADPTGYGRIVRENGQIVRIVEHKDADAATRAVREINTGIMVVPTPAAEALAEGPVQRQRPAGVLPDRRGRLPRWPRACRSPACTRPTSGKPWA
jgi:bifunctional UDP-N-acetylglucosamine pyrophosphorylase/glucosamine-1-phosphate N-acetyltransferase